MTGFFVAVLTCGLAIMNDPHDTRLDDYFRTLEQKECREMDKTMGYEKALQKERERNPQLYDA